MTDLPPIAVVLTADTSDFKRGMNSATREINDLDGTARKGFGGIGKASLAFAAVGVGAVVAGAALFDFGKDAVVAAQEAAVADARLLSIATSMGFVSGAYAGGVYRLNEYSTALQKSIGVDDESIKAVQAKLLTFKQLGKTMNETGGMMDRATAAAYDLASAGFGSAESNAKGLGKALQDPIKGITALGRAGVTFTEQEKNKIKTLVESNRMGKAQEMVMKAIEVQVGGTAEATATSTQKMKVSFGELQEKIGTSILPVISSIADALIPLFDNLQGPLSVVAEAIGGTLKKAFDSIAPLLPVLAQAIGKIAGALGGILAGAIQALLPVFTPLLTLLGTLVGKIGPILTPLLTKIGTLFSKLMEAVIPLITPLTEVVMGILDAAAPILGVVIDALIILVKALTPVLGAVSQLIKPLGTLITVLLKAIMPVITPLLPVIEALATVLGDVLTRAVGVLMTAIGYLIQGFAEMAPFILHNVTGPVAALFLDFASSIIDSAEKAFSWIPGLGDKLSTAKTAIDNFKVTSVKAIANAATTIGNEGKKIGQGLIDNGVGMLTNPALAQQTQQSATNIGLSFGTGIVAGMGKTRDEVAAGSKMLIKTADSAARAAAASNSPSLLFAEIGKDLADGLVKGVKDGGDDVKKTLKDTFHGWFTETISTMRDDIKTAQDVLTQGFSNMRNAISGGVSLGDAWQAQVDDVTKRADLDKQIADAIASGDTSGQAKAQAEKAAMGTAVTWHSAYQTQLSQSQWFVDVLTYMKAQGTDQRLIDDVASMGPGAGGALIQDMIDKGMIPTFNEQFVTVQDTIDAQAKTLLPGWMQNGVDSAKNTVDGFKKQFGKGGAGRKHLMDLMDNLAADAKRSVAIDVYVTKNVTEIISRIPGPAARAAGGPVTQNNPYMVGEKGPELFVPNTSGTIIPNDSLGSGTINVYAQTNADAHDISREIAWALKVGV